MSQKYQNDSKAEFTGRPSETGSDSDSAEGTEGEDTVPASSVIYSSKSSWQPSARSKFWGVSGSEDRGGGDNSIQFINIGRVGDKSFEELRQKMGGWGEKGG